MYDDDMMAAQDHEEDLGEQAEIDSILASSDDEALAWAESQGHERGELKARMLNLMARAEIEAARRLRPTVTEHRCTRCDSHLVFSHRTDELYCMDCEAW